jgi:hypothetical protein
VDISAFRLCRRPVPHLHQPDWENIIRRRTSGAGARGLLALADVHGAGQARADEDVIGDVSGVIVIVSPTRDC